MDNTKAIALLRRMQEPEVYEPQITAEAFEALGMAIRALEQASFPQRHENDLISRQAAVDAITEIIHDDTATHNGWIDPYYVMEKLKNLPSAQPQYEELTPEEAASEIASGSIMSAWYWLDDMRRLQQMGYVICRER